MDWYTRLRAFMTQVSGEMKHVTWPSWTEVRGTTAVVILTVFAFALFLYVVDTVLFKMVDWVFTVAG